MSKQTYQDFEQHLESYMLIDQKLRSIANKYADEFEGGGYVEGIEVDYDGVFGTVEVTGSIPTRCGCCSDDIGSRRAIGRGCEAARADRRQHGPAT